MTLVTADKASKRIQEMDAFIKKLEKDKNFARKFAVKTGIWDKNGKLTKPYR